VATVQISFRHPSDFRIKGRWFETSSSGARFKLRRIAPMVSDGPDSRLSNTFLIDSRDVLEPRGIDIC